MVRRLVLALLVAVTALPHDALANGRPPGTSSIAFKNGDPNEIVVGLTFGLLFSHDAGKTWTWMCENAIGYTGMYDPVYAYASSGALFATTYDGLKVVRDSCTFAAMPSGLTFTSANTIGPDGAFYFAAAQTEDTSKSLAKDFKIYKSTDDGKSFPVSAKPGDPADTNDWWQSVLVAPSDKTRVYVSGYSYQPAMAGAEPKRTQLLFKSTNGGASYVAMKLDGIAPIAVNSVLHLVGVTADDANHLYLRVEYEDNTISDALYRSTDAGTSWTRMLGLAGPITTFVVRKTKTTDGKYELIAGNKSLGTQISHDDGVTWAPLAGAPHLNCLVESPTGELWGCTQNYDNDPSAPSDNAGVMKTTDLVTWTKVLRYQELTQAVTCAAGTKQHDDCAAMWCAVCAQLGCKPDASYACPQPTEAVVAAKSGGCCETGGGSAGGLALALMVGTVVRRPRRRRAHP